MSDKDMKREEFLRNAERMYDELISRAGPKSGDTFSKIEVHAEAMGRKLVRGLLAGRLAAEAGAETGETVICPECGNVMRRPKKPGERHLETASGPVGYERHHAIRDRCGSSFSPSGRPAAHPGEGGVEPPEA